jgi:pyrroloquinoline quinone (PQQ) biosynthesis protein C
MPDARKLIEEIRGELQPMSQRIRTHPYIEALAEQRIERDKLRIFAGEQYNIIKYDMRSFALLLSRQSDFKLRQFFMASVPYEAAAFEAILPFAAALGMSESDLEAYEPLPGAHMYPAFLALTATYGSAAEMAGAFIIDMEGWGGNCAAMSRILKEGYGLSPDRVRFFDHFAAEDPTFEPRSLEVVQAGLDAGVEPRLIHRTSRLMLSYELLYWDTVYEASVS